MPNYRQHFTFKSLFRNKRSKLDNEQCTGGKCYVTVQSAKASRYETLLSSPHGFSLFNPHYYYRKMTRVAPFKIFWSLQCDESLNSLRGRLQKKKDLTDSWWLHKYSFNVYFNSLNDDWKMHTPACWAAMWNDFAYRFTRQSTFFVFLFNRIMQTWVAFDCIHID